MLINIPRRQIIGGLLVAALFAAMIAFGLSHPSPADDSSASKASGFSPYVTKDVPFRGRPITARPSCTWAVGP